MQVVYMAIIRLKLVVFKTYLNRAWITDAGAKYFSVLFLHLLAQFISPFLFLFSYKNNYLPHLGHNFQQRQHLVMKIYTTTTTAIVGGMNEYQNICLTFLFPIFISVRLSISRLICSNMTCLKRNFTNHFECCIAATKHGLSFGV